MSANRLGRDSGSSRHSCIRSRTTSNSTCCATTRAVWAAPQAGSHSRGCKRARIYASSCSMRSRDLATCAKSHLSCVCPPLFLSSSPTLPFRASAAEKLAAHLLMITRTPNTGVLKWRTYCVAASHTTSAHTHRTHPNIIPTWPARAAHRIPHRDVSTCARGPHTPACGARADMLWRRR